MRTRLQQLLDKEGLTPVRFSEIVGVQRSSVSHILSGRNNPGLEFIQKILTAFPHVSSDWLILGNGDMYQSGLTSSSIPKEDIIKDPQPKATANLFTVVNDEDEPYYGKKTLSNEKKVDTLGLKDNFKTEGEKPLVGLSNDPLVERIVVFYADRTFKEYFPG
jgi:transcriptional regulator with XRE-family HTH domain